MNIGNWEYLIALVVVTLVSPVLPSRAETAHVAVAANFQAPLDHIASIFEAETGHNIVVSSASTGLLTAQIQQGAPFDVLLAADRERPAKLVEAGFAVPGSAFTYATGRLVFIETADLTGDDPKTGLQVVSIANPRTAPYGAAAQDALKHAPLPDGAKLSLARNVTGVIAAVRSGAAQAGYAALSAFARPDAREIPGTIVPAAHHAAIRQDAVLLTNGAENPAAQALLAFLRIPRIRATIAEFGYDVD